MAELPIAIDVVVECQFLVFENVSLCKDTHSNPRPYGPSGNIAVRIAAVICESTDSPSFGSVDKLWKL